MKILYLIDYAGKAGTEKYVSELMRRFSAQGHDCHLCYGIAGELSAEAERTGFPTLTLDMRPKRVFAAARTLSDYCRENGIDVVHAQYPRENVIAVLAKRRYPLLRVVFTSHLTIRQGIAWRIVNRLITPHDSAVISVCEEGVALLRKNGVDARKLRVIRNGLAELTPLPHGNVLRSELSLPEDCFVFLTLARCAPEKGLFSLLEAAALLKKKTDRPFAVCIAGDGELFAALGDRIRALGLSDCVFLLGYRTDAPALLASADAFVSSSLYNEAMSFSVLEAMRQGLPLAVTSVGAGAELARQCGFVAPPGDANAMAENLLRLLSDKALCRTLGSRASERIREEFDLARLTEELFSVYSTE